ncbi:MAG: hypothetical protein R3F34_16135 [Planctomycetota bacterium]
MRRGLVLLASAALLASSCAVPPRDVPLFARAQVVSDFSTYVVRRVGVLPVLVPSSRGQAHPGEASFLQDWFVTQVSLGTPYEVVGLPPESLAEIDRDDPRLRGSHDVAAIVELAKRFKLDGVLLVQVVDQNPYPPQNVFITAELVATETGATIWSSDVHLDARDPRVRAGLEAFASRDEGSTDGADDWSVVMLSPRRFAEYGLWQIAQML